MQNLPVVMCVDRAGKVGADGETHQGVFDLSFFKIIPNITIMAPKDFKELEQMLEFAISLKKPAVIRYPRGGEPEEKFKMHKEIKLGKSELLQEGKDVTLIGIGKGLEKALEKEKELKQNGKSVEIINCRFLKPLDKEQILKSIKKTKNVITFEDNSLIGGLGSSLKGLIIDEKLQNINITTIGYEDKFISY